MKRTLIALLFWLGSLLTVSAQNHPPVPVADSFNLISQVPALLDVVMNDYDPDGDSIWVTSAWIWDPARDYLQIIDGKVSYTPGYEELQVSINYHLVDQHGAYNYGSIVVNVIPHPNAPVTVDDTIYIPELQDASLDVLANDFDPDGDVIKIKQIYTDCNCITVSEDSLSILISPVSFSLIRVTYWAQETGTDEKLISFPGVLNIRNINSPVAVPDSIVAYGGIPINIPVMDNDFDLQGDEFRIYDVSESYGLTLQIVGDSIRCTPDYSFSGNTYFNYRLVELNNELSISYYGPVTVKVIKNPDCPVIVNDTVCAVRLEPLIIDVMANDYDPQNEDIEICNAWYDCEITPDNKILFRPQYNTPDIVIINYMIREVDDNQSYSDYGTVTIYLADNPHTPIAFPDTVTTTAGIPVKLRPLDNDIISLPDTAILWTDPRQRLSRFGVHTDSSNYLIYKCAYTASGVDSLVYYALNQYGIKCLWGKVYIEVLPQKFAEKLDINNIQALVNADGYLFNDLIEIPNYGLFSQFETSPYFRLNISDSSNSTIFCSNLWIAGNDQDDSLHVSGECFKPEHGVDFKAGPISDSYNNQHYLKYGRVWKLNSNQITYHRQHYNSAGYKPPDDIASWPGNGDAGQGEMNILAPFFDNNNDGFYRWEDGDYPLIRGDQAIYLMYHDDVLHSASWGTPLKVEVHAMIYGFGNPADTALYNSVFVHYDIINRSENTYHDTRLSVFTDLDIGWWGDDMIGCDVTRGSYYSYDIGDIDYGGQELYGFGNQAPSQGITILAGPYMDSDGNDNPQGMCDESINGLNFGNQVIDDERSGLAGFAFFGAVTSNPPNYIMDPRHYSSLYQYMTGRWQDGTPFLYGGTGHGTDGTVGPECRFIFPGNSDPLNWGTACNYPGGGYNQNNKFWTEEESGIAPGEIRGLGTMGTFTFKPGDIQQVDLAYCTGLHSPNSSSLNQLFRNIDSIRAAVKAGKIIQFDNLLDINPEKPIQKLSVFPNPAMDFIKIKGLKEVNCRYTIYNLPGLKIQEGYVSDNLINTANIPAGTYIIRLVSSKSENILKFVLIR